MLKRICRICKKDFFVPNNYGKKRGFYCSQKCYGTSKKGKPSWNKGIHTGIIPKTAFKKGIIPKTHWKKGHKPWNKGLKGYMALDKHFNWNGGKTVERGYVCIHSPKHPFKRTNNYVFEHRLVMEKHLGRYLKSTEQIHHINGNKSDNRLENLMYFPNNSAHIKFHRLTRYQQ